MNDELTNQSWGQSQNRSEVGSRGVALLLVGHGDERLARQPPKALGGKAADGLKVPADVRETRVTENAHPLVAGEPRVARRGHTARHQVVGVPNGQRVVHETVRVHVRPLRPLRVHRKHRARARHLLAARAAANPRALPTQ